MTTDTNELIAIQKGKNPKRCTLNEYGFFMPNPNGNVICAVTESEMWTPIPDWEHNIAAAFDLVQELKDAWPNLTGYPAKYWQFVSQRDGTWTAMIRIEYAGMKVPGFNEINPVLSRKNSHTLAEAICHCYLDYKSGRLG